MYIYVHSGAFFKVLLALSQNQLAFAFTFAFTLLSYCFRFFKTYALLRSLMIALNKFFRLTSSVLIFRSQLAWSSLHSSPIRRSLKICSAISQALLFFRVESFSNPSFRFDSFLSTCHFKQVSIVQIFFRVPDFSLLYELSEIH
jgi:hypothetical protein